METLKNSLYLVGGLLIIVFYNNCAPAFKSDTQENSSQTLGVGNQDNTPETTSPSPSDTQMLSSIERHGITWTFDKAYPVTHFINGDYAVVAGEQKVVVLSVSPEPKDGKNGSGINIKADQQPADSRAPHYVPSIQFPAKLKAGDALVSFISKLPEHANCDGSQGSNLRNVMGYCSRSNVKGASVLTVVKEAPSEFSFRPAALGGPENRRHYSLVNIDEVVENLPKLQVDSMMDIDRLIRSRNRFQFEADHSWQRRYSAPAENQSTYAAYSLSDEALLALAGDYPFEKKKELLIATIQHGIELEGASRVGALVTHADGGHGTHALSVMAVTSELLGNKDFTNYIRDLQGPEKLHTFLGVNGDGLWGKTCDHISKDNFEAVCNGTYRKGSKDCRDPNGLQDSCSGYLGLNATQYRAQALAMGLLGAVDDFNHRAFFLFTDRYMIERNLNDKFTDQMWKKYRSTINW